MKACDLAVTSIILVGELPGYYRSPLGPLVHCAQHRSQMLSRHELHELHSWFVSLIRKKSDSATHADRRPAFSRHPSAPTWCPHCPPRACAITSDAYLAMALPSNEQHASALAPRRHCAALHCLSAPGPEDVSLACVALAHAASDLCVRDAVCTCAESSALRSSPQ